MSFETILKHKRFLFFGAFLFLLIVFYFFSVQVKKDKFKTINFDTTVRIQDKVHERLGGELEDLTFFVDPVSSSVFVLLLTGVAFIDLKHKRLRFKALIIPLAFLLLVGAEVYGKDRVESPAPPFFMIKNPTTMFPKYHVVDQYSYPSGHAGRSLFIAGILLLLSWKFLYRKFNYLGVGIMAAVLLGGVILISVGKIYLGQHWLSDIIGGWILATAFLSFVATAWL